MAFQNISMDLSTLNNITPLNISVNGANVFENIISVSNASTNDLGVLASLLIILAISYFTLSDKTPFGDFGYDDMRSLCISLAISTLLGFTLISVGWTGNFYIIGMFTTLYLLNFIMIMKYENPE